MISLSALESSTAASTPASLPRYAIAGFSTRGIFQYVMPLLGITRGNPGRLDLSTHGRVVGAFDLRPERVREFNELQGASLPVYDSLEEMIAFSKPDVVLVMGPDSIHAEHILTALEAGCDVIAEKPMVISTAEAEAVRQAERKTGRTVKMAFNLRYSPPHKKIREILASGRLGKITNIEFSYNLDTYHGASYFRRWNRTRAMTGGLQIHKSCHHLDLIQWWLDSWPRQVFAYGARNYYGREGWHNPERTEGRTMDSSEQRSHCPYFQKWHAPAVEVQDDHLAKRNSPAAQTVTSGPYIYDAEIDIEDTYAAVVTYDNGAMMTYSCNFSAPYEGYSLGINGTLGRLETNYYAVPSRCPFPVPPENRIRIMPLFGAMEEISLPQISGGHGGADGAIQHDLFIGIRDESARLHLPAGSLAGAYAVSLGESIARSISENLPVTLPRFEADSE